MIKLWKKSKKENTPNDQNDIVRFNEAIDQALTESISYYVEKLNDSRNLFLGILTHDMRNPLGAMLMSAELVPKIGPLNPRQVVLMGQITDSGARVTEIVSHLLDITRARFGSGLPVIKGPMDFAFVGRKMVEEMQAIHPDHKFTIEISGNTEGNWDQARIAQVFSNLMGNAVQYGFKSTPISINIAGEPNEVVVRIYNDGAPINPEKIGQIFDSLVRIAENGTNDNKGQTANLGLGLFITKEIVVAHGGTITVASTEKEGTTFTACFPRNSEVPNERLVA